METCHMVRQLLLMFLLTIENHTEIIKLRYALLYESLLCYVTSLYFMLRYVVLCCLLLCFIIFYYAILFDITSCYIVEDKPYSSLHSMTCCLPIMLFCSTLKKGFKCAAYNYPNTITTVIQPFQ